jgi:hypothetical protein
MIRTCVFQEKEKEGGEGRPQLGGQWKVPMLGGQWGNILLGGLRKEKEKHIFHCFSFSPSTNFIQTSFFH